MILWKNVVYGLLMALLGVAAVAFSRAQRRWIGRIREVAERTADPNARAQFMQSEEYRRLQRSAQRPMFAATILFLALLLLMRFE